MEIEIGSGYGERYDQDIPDLAEIAMLKRGALATGARVLNLGANHGVIALMLAKTVGETGLVVAVEANPYDFEVARSNAARNGVGQLEVINAAVARTSGLLEFGLDGRVQHQGARMGRRRVPALSIDDLSTRYGRPDVVFMDVEGYELEALRGAAETIEHGADWFVEVHAESDLALFGASAPEIVDRFAWSRYERWVARPGLRYTTSGRLVEETEFRRLDALERPPRGRFFLVALDLERRREPIRSESESVRPGS